MYPSSYGQVLAHPPQMVLLRSLCLAFDLPYRQMALAQCCSYAWSHFLRHRTVGLVVQKEGSAEHSFVGTALVVLAVEVWHFWKHCSWTEIAGRQSPSWKCNRAMGVPWIAEQGLSHCGSSCTETLAVLDLESDFWDHFG